MEDALSPSPSSIAVLPAGVLRRRRVFADALTKAAALRAPRAWLACRLAVVVPSSRARVVVILTHSPIPKPSSALSCRPLAAGFENRTRKRRRAEQSGQGERLVILSAVLESMRNLDVDAEDERLGHGGIVSAVKLLASSSYVVGEDGGNKTPLRSSADLSADVMNDEAIRRKVGLG